MSVFRVLASTQLPTHAYAIDAGKLSRVLLLLSSIFSISEYYSMRHSVLFSLKIMLDGNVHRDQEFPNKKPHQE